MHKLVVIGRVVIGVVVNGVVVSGMVVSVVVVVSTSLFFRSAFYETPRSFFEGSSKIMSKAFVAKRIKGTNFKRSVVKRQPLCPTKT